ncbi:MAG: alpha-hydroxy-acid oxidizing protein [Acidimicrobiia bacterium]|nr:alpha-hydroxy-acid oxidizing protein [Acidimicrobiia bacterium]
MSIYSTLRSVMRFRRFERDPVARRLRKAANVADLRRIAKRRLPRGVFDYIDGGAEDEYALNRNSAVFRDAVFRPRVLRNVGKVDASTTILGKRVPFPLVLAPTGFTRIADSPGELAVARAAARAEIPYTLSTLGTRSIEEVAAVSDGRKWFQVYVWKDRGLVAEMLDRAAAAAYEAIVITVDTAVLGRRERDVRRGFSLPPKLGPGTVIDGMVHPGWTWDFVNADPISFANVTGKTVGDGADAISLAEYVGKQFDPGLSWDDIAWFREHWDGPIVLKGVQTVEDALIAAEHDIAAVALSNHGGRQLDGAPAPLHLVDPVAEAVGDRVEVICDGGVRRGSDIVKAVALGATACMAGRAYLYGLGAAGERGVDFVLDHLSQGVEQTMTLVGATTIDELEPNLVNLA